MKTTFGRTTIDKPAYLIGFSDVMTAVDLQYVRSAAEYKAWEAATAHLKGHDRGPRTYFTMDYDGLTDFIKLAAKNAFPKLSDEVLNICAGRNYEDRHASFSDMVWGMQTECEFASNILNAK